jgi:hypothetical protein
MKRNVEKARRFLKALVSLSIDTDKPPQDLCEIRSAVQDLEKREDDEEIKRFLELVADNEAVFQKQCQIAETLRHKGEAILWKRQRISPQLDRSVEDLEISDTAAGCVPFGVETIGQLCQYTPSELQIPDSRYKNELRDVLGNSYVLVLKPEGLLEHNE